MLVLGAGVVIGTSFVVNRIKQPDVIKETKEVFLKTPTCAGDFSEYNRLKDSGQTVQIISNAPMYATNGELRNLHSVTVKRSGDDQVACGYLYVRARKNGNPLEEQYESVYINPHGFGGHILPTKGAIPIPSPMTSKTEFLLPLNSVAYLPSLPFDPNAQNFRIANWTNLLNVSNSTTFLIGISASDPRAVMEEVRVVYKCWDSTTGKETAGCQLGIGK